MTDLYVERYPNNTFPMTIKEHRMPVEYCVYKMGDRLKCYGTRQLAQEALDSFIDSGLPENQILIFSFGGKK